MMRSCILVRWRLSRACTLRASVKSKRCYIAPWPKHGLRSESCASVSALRKPPYLSSSNLASRTFGGYSRQRNAMMGQSWRQYSGALKQKGSSWNTCKQSRSKVRRLGSCRRYGGFLNALTDAQLSERCR